MGERCGTSEGLPQGRISLSRSTPGWQSQDLAEATRRAGTRAPWSRAKVPTAKPRSGSQGKAVAPAGRSCEPGR